MPADLDAVADQLRRWRAEAGSPSFTEIARRVGEIRADPSRPEQDRHPPGRVTVYDCFATGRRRIDVALVTDIAQALGIQGEDLERWRRDALLARGGAAPTSSIALRRGLPPRQQPFVGRDAELAACLDGDGPLLVTGMAGVGKSSLVAALVHELASRGRCADAVVLTLPPDAAGLGSADVAEAALRSLDPGAAIPAGARERARRLVRALTAADTVLVVEDVTDPDQVLALLAAGPRSPLVLASRQAFDLPGVRRVTLEPWDATASLDLVRAVAGDEAVDADPDAALRLGAVLDGLPLAVSLAAARVRDQAGWTLGDHVDALDLRLATHHLDPPVEASIDLSYGTLAPGRRRALRLLAAAPCQEVSVATAQALLGSSATAARADLEALTRAGCLRPGSAAGRFALHALLRTFATARSLEEDPPSARADAVARLVAHLHARTLAAVEVVYPGSVTDLLAGVPDSDGAARPTAEAASAWLEDELESVLQVVLADADDHPRAVAELARALARHLDVRGRSALALAVQEAGLRAAHALRDPTTLTYAELGVGQTSVRLGLTTATGHLRRAQELGREAGAVRAVLSASNALAILAANGGDLPGARRHFETALGLAHEHGMAEAVTLVSDNLAVVLRRLGDLYAALALHRAALTQAGDRGDDTLRAASLVNVSEVLLLTGDAPAAEASAREALTLARRLGETATEGYGMANLAIALAHQGRLAEAVELQRAAVEHARTHEITALEPAALVNLGEHLEQTDAEAARERFSEGRDVAESLDHAFERLRAMQGLARLALLRGDVEEAAALVAVAQELTEADAVGPEAQETRRLAAALEAAARAASA